MLTLRNEYACFSGTVAFYSHPSELCHSNMNFAVFIPPQAKDGPVPVLYFLSGLTCTEENFTTKAGAQRYAAEHGLLLVAPDTSPRNTGIAGEDDQWDIGSGAGFYVDATTVPWRKHYKMYSYITEELPRLVQANFPASDRAGICGHSMGGHGALVCGLRLRDRYRSISAIAPIAAPTRCPWGKQAFSTYLGEHAADWRAYDASEVVQMQQHPYPILVDQGEEDSFLAQGQLLPEVFEAACQQAGQALTLRRHPGYDHSYYFVATVIGEHIAHHAEALHR
ncbi:MAG: S-formylglutathione hydrolase [Cyanobacteria bacterium P01_A01_bin.135]